MSVLRPTIKDLFLRTILEFKSNLRYITGKVKYGGFVVPEEYKIKFDEIFWDDYRNNWESAETWWGPPYHPSFLNQWYDSEQIIQQANGLNFAAVMKPRYFPEIDTTIPVAIGIVRSKEAWQYGIFSFKAMLPSGQYLWPALWLSGLFNWPPEIDLLESYSHDTIDYHKNKNSQSNIHIKPLDGSNTGSDSAAARTHKLPNHITETFIDYVIWWEKDFIKLYYNGYLVRHITDRRLLDGMFEAQRIIIGTGTQVGFNINNITPMAVAQVTVYQK